MEHESEINNKNRIFRVNNFTMKVHASIVSSNLFFGGYADFFPYKEYSSFLIGAKSRITSAHHFDITDSITIGTNVVFGGIHSSVWTHGFDIQRTMIQSPVTVGNNIYIGSGSIICQGVDVADNSIIAAGTVVSKSIIESGFYISNQLMKKSNIQSYAEEKEVITYKNAKFYRKNK
jgi:acetyltransferase-like isoleucine patch superfamily enzyme